MILKTSFIFVALAVLTAGQKTALRPSSRPPKQQFAAHSGSPKFEALASAGLVTHMADLNDDGALDVQELAKSMQITPSQAKSMIADYDQNSDQKIQPREAVAVLEKAIKGCKPDLKFKAQAMKIANKIISMADKDKDGAVSTSELAQATGRTDADVEKVMKFLDQDKNSQITAQELAAKVDPKLLHLAVFFIHQQQKLGNQALLSKDEASKTILQMADENKDGKLDDQEKTCPVCQRNRCRGPSSSQIRTTTERSA